MGGAGGVGGVPLGGTVLAVDHDANEVTVLRQYHGDISRLTMDLDEVDPATVTYYGADARKAATVIHGWLSRQKRVDHDVRVEWSMLAVLLDQAGQTGTYTQGAERRRVRDAERSKRQAS